MVEQIDEIVKEDKLEELRRDQYKVAQAILRRHFKNKEVTNTKNSKNISRTSPLKEYKEE
jgi:hypothetical protein